MINFKAMTNTSSYLIQTFDDDPFLTQLNEKLTEKPARRRWGENGEKKKWIVAQIQLDSLVQWDREWLFFAVVVEETEYFLSFWKYSNKYTGTDGSSWSVSPLMWKIPDQFCRVSIICSNPKLHSLEPISSFIFLHSSPSRAAYRIFAVFV